MTIYDHHVHLMSPDLIQDWKTMGIPFSKPDAHYANLDTILLRNEAEFINLIGMGYVYGNPEYYQGEDAHERLREENDFLLHTAAKNPEGVRPFIAIDPLKDYASDELDRCFALNPDIGLKLHFNASQVYLTEPEHRAKVKPLFLKAAEQKIPVLLHFDNSHPKFGRPDVELLADSILTELPPMRLTIAHLGTSGGFNAKTKRVLDAFIAMKAAGRIPGNHQLLFDISAVALDKDSEDVSRLTDNDFSELNAYIRKIGVDNISFGTDYPLYSSRSYLEILKNRVGLTEEELLTIMKNVN